MPTPQRSICSSQQHSTIPLPGKKMILFIGINQTDKKDNSSSGVVQGQALRVFEKIFTLIPRVVFFQKTLTLPVLVHFLMFIGFIYP